MRRSRFHDDGPSHYLGTYVGTNLFAQLDGVVADFACDEIRSLI